MSPTKPSPRFSSPASLAVVRFLFSHLKPLARRKILANPVNGNCHTHFTQMPNDNPRITGKTERHKTSSRFVRLIGMTVVTVKN